MNPHAKKKAKDQAFLLSQKEQQEATHAAAKGLLEQLKRCVVDNRERTIRSLTMNELEHMAAGCISAWTKERAEQEKRDKEPLNDSIADLWT